LFIPESAFPAPVEEMTAEAEVPAPAEEPAREEVPAE
jgi:hypothetical protein